MKVTVHDNAQGEPPSEKIVNAANRIVHVSDAKGRKLGLKQPDFLEEFRIIEALGSELSANTTYMSMLNPLLYLVEIDGEPILTPRTKLQAEALIQRAGREGFQAVVNGLVEHFAGNPAEFADQVKNG